MLPRYFGQNALRLVKDEPTCTRTERFVSEFRLVRDVNSGSACIRRYSAWLNEHTREYKATRHSWKLLRIRSGGHVYDGQRVRTSMSMSTAHSSLSIRLTITSKISNSFSDASSVSSSPMSWSSGPSRAPSAPSNRNAEWQEQYDWLLSLSRNTSSPQVAAMASQQLKAMEKDAKSHTKRSSTASHSRSRSQG